MRYIYYKEVIAPSDLIEPLESYIAILALMHSYIVPIHSDIAFLVLLAFKAAPRCFKASIVMMCSYKVYRTFPEYHIYQKLYIVFVSYKNNTILLRLGQVVSTVVGVTIWKIFGNNLRWLAGALAVSVSM